MAIVIDGRKIAREVRAEVASGVAALREKTGIIPRLDVVLVGDDPASKTYVSLKTRASEEVGIVAREHRMSASTPEGDVISLVDELNNNYDIHGILVQLPLPKGIHPDRVIERINPLKDVDGITPENFGRLLTLRAPLEPCTPSGIMELLHRYKVAIEGKSAVIVGRSNIVGKPIALMLMREHATVTICHTKTPDLPHRVGEADIVIAAAGKPEMIKGAWIKQGASVIDVGVNRLANGKLVGDVEFFEAEKRAAIISPVPGGVGPMTIAMLMKNTLAAAAMKSKG